MCSLRGGEGVLPHARPQGLSNRLRGWRTFLSPGLAFSFFFSSSLLFLPRSPRPLPHSSAGPGKGWGSPGILGLSATGRLGRHCFCVPLGFPSGASGDPMSYFPQRLAVHFLSLGHFLALPREGHSKGSSRAWCALVSMRRSLLTASAFCSHQVCVD